MKDLYLVGSGINILSHYTIFIIKGWYSRFHGVEIHVAHGFLIQNFISPFFNQRTAQWGGNLKNRLRFPLPGVQKL
jgi:hypothetical protein